MKCPWSRAPGTAATLEDLRAVPDDRVAHLVDGQIYSHARPRVAHAELNGVLYRELANSFNDTRRGGPGGWLFLVEPELALGGNVLVPDIAAWRRERLARAPATTQISLRPDWVCEVLSKGTEAFDRGPKRRAYLQSGVPHLWYVQPEAKLIEVYGKQGDFYASVAEGSFVEPIKLEPFETAAVELCELGEWIDATEE
jgi:Uma2 family endonuclease